MNTVFPEVVVSADARQVGGSHYRDMQMQPWDVMQAVLTPEEFRGFLKGNVIKYAMRQGKKDGTDDAGKAQHYAQKLAEIDSQAVPYIGPDRRACGNDLSDMVRAGKSVVPEDAGGCGNVGREASE